MTKEKTEKRNRESEPEIRLKNLFSFILHRWKVILAVMILLAAALGGWQYLKTEKIHAAGEQTKDELRYEQDVRSYEEKLKNAQDDVDSLQALLDWRKSYRDNALLMQLDPENIWTAERTYLVSISAEEVQDSPGNDSANVQNSAEDASGEIRDWSESVSEGSTLNFAEELLAVYTNAMETDHDEAALEAAFGTISAGNAKEIVEITANTEAKTFRAAVHAASQEAAEKGLAYVDEKVRNAEKNAQGIRLHTLRVIAEGTARDILPKAAEVKTVMTEEIMRLESALEKAESLLVDARVSVPYNPGNPVVRWAVTGAALGLIIMVFIYLTLYVCSQKRVTGDRHH